MMIDDVSLLALAEGTTTLAELESRLAARGLTIGFPVGAEIAPLTVADWIAKGMPGAPSAFADPASHVIAGLDGTVGTHAIAIKPCPRRAVGPDLVALFAGTGGSLGKVARAWLRVERADAARPSLPLPGVHLDPAPSEAEKRLVEALERELAK